MEIGVRRGAGSPAGSAPALRSDGVDRSLDEGLELRDVPFLQLAAEIRHALVAEWTVEDDVPEIGNHFGADIAEIDDVAAAVDAGHAVAGYAGRRDIDVSALPYILRIVL